jgi:serine/threonine-protein kinase
MSQHNPTAMPEGGVFHGRYQIVRCLKAGGMGAVYECIHLTTQKRRALKVMLPQLLAAAGMRERFELEARVTAQIESEHIVETFDAGVDGSTGAPFLVMELLRGDDLDGILQACGPFTAQETVVLLSQAALALDKTHAAGIVHRDLKPQNLFLTTRDDGSPRLKILDFGIAKVVADGTKTAQRTEAIGTPIYMAPEQMTGDGTIGPAADLYALGHIAYALLSGQAYWMEEQQTLPVYAFLGRMLAGLSERPTTRASRSGVTLPAAFDDWFLRATTRKPSDRFASASTLVVELATALGTPAPRLLLATPPALGQRLSIAGSLPTPANPGRSGSHVAARSSSVALGAGATGASRPSGTMAALSNEPLAGPPMSSRAPMVTLAIVGIGAAAAGLFGVVRALHGPSGGPAAPAVIVAASAPPAPAPQPSGTAPTAPEVEPAGPAGTASPLASSASPREPAKRPKPPAPTPPPPVKPTATHTASPSCSPPFIVDASGVKHAKPECL